MSDATPAGYSGKPLWQKLGLEQGLRILVRDAPGDYADLVGLAAAGLDLVSPHAAFDLAHLFATRAIELSADLKALAARLPPTGVIWISWPKKAARVPTDITEDTIRRIALPIGLVDVKVYAVDVEWSGLKLVWRRENRPAARQQQKSPKVSTE
jgi:hypothetical protein